MLSYTIDKSQGLIIAQISDSPSTIDLMAHIQNILKDPDYAPGYNSMILISENTVIPGVTPDRIETIRNLLDGYAALKNNPKWAVVAPSTRHQVFIEYNMGLIDPAKANVRVFRREETALAWLRANE